MTDTGDDQLSAAPAAAEANESDLIEQSLPAAPDAGASGGPRAIAHDDPEVPEADAWEQSLPVAGSADDY